MTEKPRDDWKMPPKPVEICPQCEEPVKAEAYFDLDCLYLAWACSGGCTHEEIEWPFGEEQTVSKRDILALGFTEVN